MVDNGGMSHSSGAEAPFRWSLLSAQEGCVSLAQTLPEPGHLSASAGVSGLQNLGGSAPHAQMKRPANWLNIVQTQAHKRAKPILKHGNLFMLPGAGLKIVSPE